MGVTQCSTNKPTRALQNETVDSSRCFERCLGGTFQSAAGERSTSRHRLVQKRNQPGWKLQLRVSRPISIESPGFFAPTTENRVGVDLIVLVQLSDEGLWYSLRMSNGFQP